MEPIISFRDYTFKYRAQIEPTLFNINLDINPGEKILIVGPSGSGKSTISNSINGLIPFAYSGDITGSLTVKGKSPKDLGIFGLSKYVGTVLQDTDGQFIGLTVAEDVAFAMENNMVPQEEMKKRVAEIAETVEITNFLSQAPTAMSGGQKQRVSMAGVMVGDEEILLFDEPLANLDPATGKRTIALIDDICKDSNRTIIVIEHRLEDALYRHMDRIIVVAEGKIAADMTPDDLMCTDILEEKGIREPLYVTALKHAGITPVPSDKPGSIDTCNFEAYKERMRSFYSEVRKEELSVSDELAIEVSDLTFAYNESRQILKDINFSIRKGEMIAIAGKNGAGKTTLASIICGFLTPKTGRIMLNGEDISPLSVKERGEHIGLVMQNPNQMISKSLIYDEVALGLQVRGVAPEIIKERVEEALKTCGLYPFRNWPISALSFGQKKRVTIASILAMDPEILILDEPTAGQDYRHYTEIMEFIRKLNKEKGLTIIMITHDMHLMLEYTDRTIVIADGELLTIDTPANILTCDEISDKAYLKRTSLYDCAVKCDMDNPSLFVEQFITYERRSR